MQNLNLVMALTSQATFIGCRDITNSGPIRRRKKILKPNRTRRFFSRLE